MLNIKQNKNSHIVGTRKILVILLVFLSVTLFCNPAQAAGLSDVVNDFAVVVKFINNNILGQIKKDFCKNYILSISTGEWKTGEFRTNLGKEICTSYRVPISTSEVTQEPVVTLNNNTNVAKIENPSTSSITIQVPGVYSSNVATDTSGTGLDANQIIYLTNQQRKINDSTLVNLQSNNILANIASIRVKDMFNYQYFEHTSPSGDNVSKEAVKNGYSYITIGENIALGNFDGNSGLLTAWMNSPGHRANILNKNYTEIGVYAAKGNYDGQSVWIAAQIFGKPISGCIAPDTNIKDKVNQYKISATSLMTSINNIDAELKTISPTDIQAYNAKVAERNTIAGLYNDLATEIKALVAEYNSEVTVYNACIKTI